MLDTKLKESKTNKNNVSKASSSNVKNKQKKEEKQLTSLNTNKSLDVKVNKGNNHSKANKLIDKDQKISNDESDNNQKNIKNKKPLDKNIKYMVLFLNIITFFIFQLYLNAKIKKHTNTKETISNTDELSKLNGNQNGLKHSSIIPFDVQKLIEYLGGAKNIKSIDSSLNSLQVFLNDREQISKDAIKKLGAKGLVVSKEKISIIFGDYSIKLKEELEQLLKIKT